MVIKQEFDGWSKSSLREICTFESLRIRHPSIVEFKQAAVDKDYNDVFIVMECMESDLKSYIKLFREENHFYNMSDVTSHVKCFMEQLFDGVKFLHENGVMHRDLKPSNVLMNRNGLLKICDFGVSRFYGNSLDSYTPDVGTLWYKAPEILLGSMNYSFAVDMWSLGCIMAELLTGEVLFKGQTEFEQIKCMYRIIGTPNEDVWPEFSSLPGSRAMFVEQPYNLLRDKFPMLTEVGFDLLNRLLSYDPQKRIKGEDALNHAWFNED